MSISLLTIRRRHRQVTANNGRFGSDTLTEGETYPRIFDEAGTFGYYCGLHPSMRGEVIVVD